MQPSGGIVTSCRGMPTLGNGEEATISDVTLSSARAFVAGLQTQTETFANHPFRQPRQAELSSRTIHGYVRTLKVFSAWLFEEDLVSRMSCRDSSAPKSPVQSSRFCPTER